MIEMGSRALEKGYRPQIGRERFPLLSGSKHGWIDANKGMFLSLVVKRKTFHPMASFSIISELESRSSVTSEGRKGGVRESRGELTRQTVTASQSYTRPVVMRLHSETRLPGSMPFSDVPNGLGTCTDKAESWLIQSGFVGKLVCTQQHARN